MTSKPNLKRLQELYPNIIFEEPTQDGSEERRRLTIPFQVLNADNPHFSIPLGPREDLRKVLSRIHTAIWTFRAQPGYHVWVLKIIPLVDSLNPGEPPKPLEMNARVSPELRRRITKIRIRRYPDDPHAQVPGTVRPGRGPMQRPAAIPGPGTNNGGSGSPLRITPNWQPRRASPVPGPDLFDAGNAQKLLAPPARRPAAAPAGPVRTRRPAKRS